ncbi:unnamed protein product [Rotaria sp. Silwood2]|nr:unnamed protein product [Rotaria sp. Silwood2]CAF2896178.1 unnamed protein product [Rotaria sp. Silwood2]CAF3197967.1 unnamed protein product [Rotaria sp. Silwood2]CAF3342958.1 unnamed protein product [Rotaria sp. Silwood2]CAF4148044.1 unnamed protein product [Rotaria sp. Silwood2]
MDLFAIILISVTIFTICGICIFIFICALQPKILRYFHRKTNRTYYITASKKQHEIQNDFNINNFDLPTKSISNDLDKRAYLKILERSVRTGRSIQDEKDNKINTTMTNTTNNNNNDSRLDLFYLLRQYINENSSSTITNVSRSTEL